jgi:hypothetical protein
MYQEDYFNPSQPNDYNDPRPQDKLFEEPKNMDRGYNVIYRKVEKKDGKIRNKKIEIYTTSGFGSHIRDAETGEYFHYLVGSKDEDLFFKVGLSSGECKSANGSNTLFYLSPQHYASHLHYSVDPVLVANWEQKRDARLAQLKDFKGSNKTDLNLE